MRTLLLQVLIIANCVGLTSGDNPRENNIVLLGDMVDFIPIPVETQHLRGANVAGDTMTRTPSKGDLILLGNTIDFNLGKEEPLLSLESPRRRLEMYTRGSHDNITLTPYGSEPHEHDHNETEEVAGGIAVVVFILVLVICGSGYYAMRRTRKKEEIPAEMRDESGRIKVDGMTSTNVKSLVAAAKGVRAHAEVTKTEEDDTNTLSDEAGHMVPLGRCDFDIPEDTYISAEDMKMKIEELEEEKYEENDDKYEEYDDDSFAGTPSDSPYKVPLGRTDKC